MIEFATARSLNHPKFESAYRLGVRRDGVVENDACLLRNGCASALRFGSLRSGSKENCPATTAGDCKSPVSRQERSALDGVLERGVKPAGPGLFSACDGLLLVFRDQNKPSELSGSRNPRHSRRSHSVYLHLLFPLSNPLCSCNPISFPEPPRRSSHHSRYYLPHGYPPISL